MRRSDREITDVNEIIEVIKRCDVCRLALNDGGWPYIVPLNFGMEYENGTLRLYFHSALEGRKLDLIRAEDRAAFEMDCGHKLQYFADRCMCTMAYESVAGRGRIKLLEGAEKADALDRLMAQYHPEGGANYDAAVISRTAVYCLTAEEFTGKRKKPK